MEIDWRTGLLTTDNNKLKRLKHEEFQNQRLRIVIGNFLENHLNLNGHYPFCFKCQEIINKPENLIRYFGLNLHPDCFKLVYVSERGNLVGTEKDYFDLVRNLF